MGHWASYVLLLRYSNFSISWLNMVAWVPAIVSRFHVQSLRPSLGELLSSRGGGLQWIWRNGQWDEQKPGQKREERVSRKTIICFCSGLLCPSLVAWFASCSQKTFCWKIYSTETCNISHDFITFNFKKPLSFHLFIFYGTNSLYCLQQEVEEGIPRRSDSWGSSTDLVVILEKLFPLI